MLRDGKEDAREKTKHAEEKVELRYFKELGSHHRVDIKQARTNFHLHMLF